MNTDDIEGLGEESPQNKKEYKKIDSSDIVAGMILINKDELDKEHKECYLVMWAGESRDGNIVIRDSSGHDYFVDPDQKDYLQEVSTIPAYRVLYGNSIEEDLKVTKEWYSNLTSFIQEYQHEGFCKLIWTTCKHIPVKPNSI